MRLHVGIKLLGDPSYFDEFPANKICSNPELPFMLGFAGAKDVNTGGGIPLVCMVVRASVTSVRNSRSLSSANDSAMHS
jgi:hypothetical protein